MTTFAKKFKDMDKIYQVSYSLKDEHDLIRDSFSTHKTLNGATKMYDAIVEEFNQYEGYTLLSKAETIAEFRINSRPDEQRLTIYINKITLQP